MPISHTAYSANPHLYKAFLTQLFPIPSGLTLPLTLEPGSSHLFLQHQQFLQSLLDSQNFNFVSRDWLRFPNEGETFVCNSEILLQHFQNTS